MPNTTNIGLNIPNTGDLPGAWGTTAVNFNMIALDGICGGIQTIAVAAATSFTLTGPTNTPGAGPNQSQNALLTFTGTLTGDITVTMKMPGRYVMHNKCTVGTHFIKIKPGGSGNTVGLPPGQKVFIFYDGTDVEFINAPPVGSALDLHGVTAVPAWITATAPLPYLVKDGSTYNISTYPALGAMLGSTFGGNGSTTFGVPDERARARIAYDSGATNRLTTAGSGVNGATMGSAGGNERMQQHTHTASIPDHSHAIHGSTANATTPGAITVPITSPAWAAGGATLFGNTDNASLSITINNAGTATSQNVQPSIVSFLPLIKT